ncbi:polyprenyl synthetase family protein [Desulfitobacterium sp.]|uniref:polyprenyl synthetase family protein n=1 Tax=Desulfitobacterium sp. TaxID=49981 RepID=UPI002B208EE1|nr:polyprenyl synthetase family protein [Desulfitobacterium sp.]MEA4902150.1 polyprenyl synthetase family protein [Desulfitobacterium sp.]
MNFHIEQAVLAGINKILAQEQLSSEMKSMIEASLNADCETGERFKWAHLTLMCCECVGGEFETGLPGAIAMELAALAADIFDDIQDQDNDELPWRQIPTENALNLAICLSMLGYHALVVLSEDKDKNFLEKIGPILSKMWITASDGQYQEILFDTREQISLDQYFELVKRKSGSLTACACKIGATLGGASESLVLQLEQFGTSLGIMSQIRNDLHDFLHFEKKNDFIKNKKTLPYVYLLNVLKGTTAEKFKELTKGLKEFGDEEQNYLRQLAVDEGAIHYCRVMYEMFREKSWENIRTLPVPEKQKEKMIRLVEPNV